MLEREHMTSPLKVIQQNAKDCTFVPSICNCKTGRPDAPYLGLDRGFPLVAMQPPILKMHLEVTYESLFLHVFIGQRDILGKA